jgi:Flp pilus assembly pilin Flp
MMELWRRLLRDEQGQDVVEYTLMIGLVVLVLWVAIRASGIDTAVTNIWTGVNGQLTAASGTGS